MYSPPWLWRKGILFVFPSWKGFFRNLKFKIYCVFMFKWLYHKSKNKWTSTTLSILVKNQNVSYKIYLLNLSIWQDFKWNLILLPLLFTHSSCSYHPILHFAFLKRLTLQSVISNKQQSWKCDIYYDVHFLKCLLKSSTM